MIGRGSATADVEVSLRFWHASLSRELSKKACSRNQPPLRLKPPLRTTAQLCFAVSSCSDCFLPGGSQRLAMHCPAWQRQLLLRRLGAKDGGYCSHPRVDPGEMGTEAGDFNALSKAASSAQQASS